MGGDWLLWILNFFLNQPAYLGGNYFLHHGAHTKTPSCLRKKDKRDERPGPYEPNQSQSRGCREGAASSCRASWAINQANPSTYMSVLAYTYIERVGELILDATIIYLFCCSIPLNTLQHVNVSTVHATAPLQATWLLSWYYYPLVLY